MKKYPTYILMAVIASIVGAFVTASIYEKAIVRAEDIEFIKAHSMVNTQTPICISMCYSKKSYPDRSYSSLSYTWNRQPLEKRELHPKLKKVSELFSGQPIILFCESSLPISYLYRFYSELNELGFTQIEIYFYSIDYADTSTPRIESFGIRPYFRADTEDLRYKEKYLTNP